MASTQSTIDGLGFEEMGQPGSQAADVWIAGSIVAQSDIITAGNVSGAGNAQFGASISGTQVNATNVIGATYVSGALVKGTTISGINIVNTDGLLQATAIDNATSLYGYQVRAGSVKTGDAASGLITFAGSFSTKNWFMTLSPSELSNPYLYDVTDASGLVPCISGAKRASGCWIRGGSQTVYDWIAVGI